MRIDQYLWFIRQFKSRNLASSACKNGLVFVNDKKVKPSKELILMDIIKIKKNKIWQKYKVLDFPKNRVGAKLVGLFFNEIISTEVLEKKEIIKLSYNIKRDKGKGRPTKKDRRDIDGILKDKKIKQ